MAAKSYKKTSPQDEAAELFKKSIDNLKAKVKAGGTLSRDQLRMLEEYGKGGAVLQRAFAKTKVELAAALGMSRPTLDRLLVKPGCPKRTANGSYDIEKFRAFYQPPPNMVPKADSPDIGTEGEGAQGSRRERILTLRAEEGLDFERWEREQKRGLWFLKSAGKEQIAKCNAKVAAELTRRFLQIAPAEYEEAQGDIEACKEINARHLEECLRFLHTGKW